jgi:DNA invertase Pin-like site-specific DNA recombinase
MLIGYARVSTDEQSLDLRLDALEAVGCTRIFTDKVSTMKADHPGLADAVSHLRHGDLLVIWKLDWLAAARRRGRVGGCKRRMTTGKVESARKLLKAGMAARDVAQHLGVSIPNLYRWVPAASM